MELFPLLLSKINIWLIVTINYFTKWVEAKPLVTITLGQEISFFVEVKHKLIWSSKGTCHR